MIKKRILQTIILIIILIGLLTLFDLVLLDKDNDSDSHGKRINFSYRMWNEFYGLEKDSIEILNFGSSHLNCGIIPAVISLENEVDVFSVSTFGVNMKAIQYQLKEALKTQSPKIVVVEAFSFVDNYTFYKASEGMKYSKNKYDILKILNEEVDPTEFFRIAHNKSNWKDDDIHQGFTRALSSEKNLRFSGYFAVNNIYEEMIQGDYWVDESKYTSEITLPEGMREAFTSIVNTCQENDIQLILVTVPFIKQSDSYIEQYKWLNGIRDICEQNNVPILHYNQQNFLHDLNFDTTMLTDEGHLNCKGAYTISNELANYIDKNYSHLLSDCTFDYSEKTTVQMAQIDEILDSTTKQIDAKINEKRLELYSYPSALATYLELLNDDRYTSIIVANNMTNKYVNQDVLTKLNELGFNYKSTRMGVFIKQGNKVLSNQSDNNIILSNQDDSIADLNLQFDLHVSIIKDGTSSILIDNNEKCPNSEGFNIVVYDNYIKKIVHIASFDTNKDQQHYYDRQDAKTKYNLNNIIYNFNDEVSEDQIFGVKEYISNDEGTYLIASSDRPMISLDNFDSKETNLLLKVEIICPHATKFEICFNDVFEREQLVTGENTVYIEMKAQTPIKDIIIYPADSSGKYMIKSVEICSLKQ